MFAVNDTVVYGVQGICVIDEITKRDFGGKSEDYYVLHTVFGNNTKIYVPIGNEKLMSRMRNLLSADEVLGIIDSMSDANFIWTDDGNEREHLYKEILLSGDRKKMLQVIKTLYTHARNQRANGRKLHIADEKVFREAEKVVYDEFAYVLGLKPENVLDFIKSRVEDNRVTM